ncbi:MAG: hypothetical protein R3F11_09745 [Verrucomicrobiales bacterium]
MRFSLNSNNARLLASCFGALAFVFAPATLMASGETVTVNLGDLPPGKRVVISYSVTVDNTIPAGDSTLSTQGSVAHSGGSVAQSDDPDAGGVFDPTTTPANKAGAVDAYTAFVQANFTPAEQGNAAISGSVQNFEGDAFTNGLDFLFNQDPKVIDLADPIKCEVVSGKVRWTFVRVTDTSGVTVATGCGPTKDNPFAEPLTQISATADTPSAGLTTMVLEDPTPVAPGSPRFFGVQVDSRAVVRGIFATDIKPASASVPIEITALSLQSFEPGVVRGTVTGVGPSYLQDSNAFWTTGMFQNGDYFVQILNATNPAAEGAVSDITASDGGTKRLTLAPDLSATLSVGDQYVIRPHSTVDGVFGPSNEAGLLAGPNSTAADNLVLLGTGGNPNQTLFFSSGTSQWEDNAATPNAGESRIFPGEGILVRRLGTAALRIYTKGEPRYGPVQVTVTTGFNLLGAIQSSGGLTLDQLGLRGDGTAGTGLADGINPSAADNIVVVNPNGTTSRYFHDGTTWRDSRFLDASAVVIPPGAAFYVIRQSPRPPFNWTVPGSAQ